MIDFIINHKWSILLSCEMLAWIFLFFMGYFRYWKPSKVMFILSTILGTILGYVPHLGIPILISIKEKSISALYETKGTFYFILCIAIIFILGFTVLKKYAKRMDAYLKKQAQKGKSNVVDFNTLKKEKCLPKKN